MSEPHTSIVRGEGSASALYLARALDAVCRWMESEERISITLAELREMSNAGYEKAGPVEERR